MITIAVANQKGGTAKTTTTANLGACLAAAGKSVLLIDFDAQGNLTDHFGLDAPDEEKHSSIAFLTEKTPEIKSIIQPVQPNLFLAPSHIGLAEIDLLMQGIFRREERLTRALDGLKYDFCLIDCAPTLGVSTINAFCAAYAVLICIQTNKWALQAIRRLMKHINDVRDEANPQLIFWALPTLHRHNVNFHKDVMAKIEEMFEEQTMPAIRYTVAFPEAAAAATSIVEYAHGSRGHQDYAELAKEVMRRVGTEAISEAVG